MPVEESKKEIKILYVWIDEYKCISNHGFNLDSKYIFDYNYEKNELSIEENKDYVEDFFSLNKERTSKITSITAIVGKNGSGKSTFIKALIDMLIIKDFNNKLIIYSKISSQGNLELFYDFDSKALNIIKSKKIISYRKINSYENPEIIYSDQLYTPLQSYYDFYKYSNFHNISQKYLLNNDAKKSSSFQESQLIHYYSEIFRQLKFLNIEESILNKIDLFKYPNFFQIKVRGIEFLKEIVNLKLDSLINELNTLIKDKILKDENGNDLYTLETDKKSFENLLELINKIKLKYNNFLDKTKVLKSKSKFIFYIALNIISINILEFKIFSKNLDPNSEEITISKYIIKELDFKNLEDKNLEFNINDISNFPQVIDYNITFIQENNYSLIEFIREIYNKSSFSEKGDSLDLPFDEISFIISEYTNLLSTDMKGIFSFFWAIEEKKNNFIEERVLSSGEYSYLSFFSRIYNLFIENNFQDKNFIFLIDECELALHPEWQRKFIKNLISFIEFIKGDNRFQIIIASHSPFIISDLPDENIIFMGHKDKVKIDDKTFASSISKIFLNSFFLENTMGDFSIKKIQYIIKKINKKDVNKDEYKKFKKILSKIGEPFIREQTLSMLNNLEIIL